MSETIHEEKETKEKKKRPLIGEAKTGHERWGPLTQEDKALANK